MIGLPLWGINRDSAHYSGYALWPFIHDERDGHGSGGHFFTPVRSL